MRACKQAHVMCTTSWLWHKVVHMMFLMPLCSSSFIVTVRWPRISVGLATLYCIGLGPLHVVAHTAYLSMSVALQVAPHWNVLNRLGLRQQFLHVFACGLTPTG